MSLPPEIAKKIKLLEISTRKLVNSTFGGQYQSAFKGQGMTFSDFREYVPGDDVRAISWNLTARTGKTYIKKYEEERELTMILAVDVSGSMVFGSKSYLKGEVATHLAGLLGFAASKNNDNVGLLLFSNQVEHFVPPKKGRGHIQRLLRDLYYHQPNATETRIDVVSDYLTGILKKRATVFIMSDFLTEESFGNSLKRLARKHEVVTVAVTDKAEAEIPNMGLIDILDPETEKITTIDTASPVFRKHVYDEHKRLMASREAEFRRTRVDCVRVDNDEDVVDPLIQYFRKRIR
ncbi:MAG: DUF58 domain-containing protein [Bdellovibrionaceae bacterium]|nr:DUF58 domain-containing protein [Pseudobdellovibrionaceae bacterium]